MFKVSTDINCGKEREHCEKYLRFIKILMNNLLEYLFLKFIHLTFASVTNIMSDINKIKRSSSFTKEILTKIKSAKCMSLDVGFPMLFCCKVLCFGTNCYSELFF